ncbi:MULTISPECIES: amidohydrolase [unclassified Lactococcus]|uniref:amidohydrolase n=1 Tax=unclassified Lactococcus TaxID=2643510 RepID=UPI0011CC8992|nr:MULTISPECIES: amidohydrolase [unclassified Lactococcus]MQW23833.1 amidohydrolase [Lactococcus sp. dk101]TXK37342.1 amidohydrolase [Lactococcus sp. dk310]TXK48654.1 amidohydrolase [Lactococcus sp. dk322]
MLEKNEIEDLIAIRHHIHQNPELSEQEFATTAFLREKIEALGIEILPSETLKTGFVAQIGSGKPVIALRADIDALPILEKTKLDFSSENEGVMHACGHDMHMTSLLGAAKILKSREQELQGTVKLIFQPAEELGTGARDVLAAGLVSDVDAFFGYHNMPTLPAGVIGLREKGVMAAVEQFDVTIIGQGSHAAYPHEGIDPILATSAIVQNLQQIVSRNVPPLEAAVLSVTHVEAGNTWNVLPDTARFEGTIRTFDEKITALTKQRFIEVVENTARAFGVRADIHWIMGSDATYNDPELTAHLFDMTKKWHEATIVTEPSSAGEDFASYRRQAPSVFAFIGSNEVGASGLHFADMTLKDEALSVAVEYYVHTAFAALDYLKK